MCCVLESMAHCLPPYWLKRSLLVWQGCVWGVRKLCTWTWAKSYVWCVRINRKFFAAILIEKVVFRLAKLRVGGRVWGVRRLCMWRYAKPYVLCVKINGTLFAALMINCFFDGLAELCVGCENMHTIVCLGCWNICRIYIKYRIHLYTPTEYK